MIPQPAYYPLRITTNGEFYQGFRLLRGGVTPMSFTAAQVRMQARPYRESDEVIVELSTANGRIAINQFDIAAVLKASETDDLDPVDAFYDIRVNPVGSGPFYLVEGPLSIVRGVTR